MVLFNLARLFYTFVKLLLLAGQNVSVIVTRSKFFFSLSCDFKELLKLCIWYVWLYFLAYFWQTRTQNNWNVWESYVASCLQETDKCQSSIRHCSMEASWSICQFVLAWAQTGAPFEWELCDQWIPCTMRHIEIG